MSWITRLAGGVAKGTFNAGRGVVGTAGKAAFGANTGTRLWNTAKMMGLGAGVGGVAGYLSDQSNNPNQKLEGAFYGAVAGAGLVFGAATTIGLGRLGARGVGAAFARSKVRIPNVLNVKTFYKGASGATESFGYKIMSPGAKYRPMTKTEFAGGVAKNFMSRMYGTGKMAGKIGLGVTQFAMSHPLAIAGSAAGIYGLAYATRMAGPDSPTLRGVKVRTNYDRQAMAAEMMSSGVAPTGTIGSYPQMQRPIQQAMQQSAEGLVQGMHRGRHG
jgi:hypothetical protein